MMYSVRYPAIGKGLVKIRKGLLNLGMHQIWIVVDKSLFSTLYLKDNVRQHGEGNNRNLLIHVYISKTKGRKYKVDSIRGVNGPESSITVTTTSDTLTGYERRKSQVNYKILYKKWSEEGNGQRELLEIFSSWILISFWRVLTFQKPIFKVFYILNSVSLWWAL